MFTKLIHNLMDEYPSIDSESMESRVFLAKKFMHQLDDNVQEIMAVARTFFGEDIFHHSEIDCIIKNEMTPQVCQVQIRPDVRYYEKLDQPVPYPANPQGYDATGLNLSFSLMTGYTTEKEESLPNVLCQFQVWGEKERKAFKQLYYNYRRIIELLLSMENIEFFTSIVFNKLEKYQDDKIAKKLDLYFDESDEENTFTLFSQFYFTTNTETMIKTFLIFSALYDSCYNCLISRRKQDKIIDYYMRFI